MGGRTPTKEETEWMNFVGEYGCIVCRNEFGIWSPCSVHHTDGRTKEGCHKKTFGLCGAHHQTGGEGVAFHATGRKTWEKKYGKEEDLLNQTKEARG